MTTDATDVELPKILTKAVMLKLHKWGLGWGFGCGKSSWGAKWQECTNSTNVGWGSSLVVEASLCYWALPSKRLIKRNRLTALKAINPF